VHEKCVVCSAANYSNFDSVFRIPACKSIKDVDVISSVEVINSSLSVDFKSVLVHLDVDWSPPNVVFTSFFKDDSLVLGTSASLFTTEVDQSTTARNDGTFLFDGIFVEGCNRGISL
jgi:hypothetical protein